MSELRFPRPTPTMPFPELYYAYNGVMPPSMSTPPDEDPALKHSAWPGEAPATLSDVIGPVWDVIPGSAWLGQAAHDYNTGKLALDTGTVPFWLPGSGGGLPALLRNERGIVGTIARGTERFGRAADLVGTGATVVEWWDTEARFARGEAAEGELWRARGGALLEVAPWKVAKVGGLALGWYSYDEEHESSGSTAEKVLVPDPTAQTARPGRAPGATTERAHGGRVRHGETTLVGERGPEIVQLPAGSDVTPAHRSRQLMERAESASPFGSGAGAQRDLHVHQYLDGREVARSTVRNLDDEEQWGWR
ncbi:hypothetical protein [Conexibacter sp. CPCC 206217]|uniref:hypothetical protein n=1 Tax=Conexibacter sp. CPCC 206217 TaxID=3064574 RepID=UPI00271C2651|nr:hypothetical protein [Conexibacter sp. CPCC 206217]MDO8209294.1 hypothetical protein [Conexibacter sp. CPCC 206217]